MPFYGCNVSNIIQPPVSPSNPSFSHNHIAPAESILHDGLSTNRSERIAHLQNLSLALSIPVHGSRSKSSSAPNTLSPQRRPLLTLLTPARHPPHRRDQHHDRPCKSLPFPRPRLQLRTLLHILLPARPLRRRLRLEHPSITRPLVHSRLGVFLHRPSRAGGAVHCAV